MSQWTHACGAIRFDALLLKHNFVLDTVENVFREYLPKGSEGPLHLSTIYTGHQNGMSGSLSVGTLVISGDLRDYDNYMGIFTWIKGSCNRLKDNGILVRGIAVIIDVEYQDSWMVRLIKQNDQKIGIYSLNQK